ncbi:MAG: SBBP repeat-containing protein [Planctomycetota bacterium]
MRTTRILAAFIVAGTVFTSPLMAKVQGGVLVLGGKTVPLGFVENGGQMDAEARFFGRLGGMTVFFTDGKMVLQGRQVVDPGQDAPAGVNLFLSFENASKTVRLEGQGELPGKVNFLRGNDPSKWATQLRTFASLCYSGLYEGVDLVAYEKAGCLEYDLVLAPGADPGKISIKCDGAEGMSIDDDGTLLLETAIGVLRQDRPATFSVSQSGERTPVECSYVILGQNRFGFLVSGWNRGADRLVIDPIMSFKTFLGGTDSDGLKAIAVGNDLSVYVAGHTLSVDFPTTPGAFDRSFNGSGPGADDAFVARLDADGSTLRYATFLGGTDGLTYLGEFASDIEVDSLGQVVVVGTTTASNFPTTVGALQQFRSGPQDGFVTKLSVRGNALVYSTYLGGTNAENISGLSLGETGNAYLVGSTSSLNFPLSSNAFDTALMGPGEFDGFVAVLDSAGATLTYSSFFGGTGNDFCLAVAVDAPTGVASVTGKTSSGDFPVSAGAFSSSSAGGMDLFAIKVDPLTPAPDFSTYLGGANLDTGNAVAIDGDGAVYLTGGVASTNFPVTPGAYDESANGGSDVFVTKISPSGLGLVFSTYLGGTANGFYPEQGNGIALGEDGVVFVTGQTDSGNFPTVGPDVDATLGGTVDAFFAQLDADGAHLIYSTHVGGAAGDFGNGVAVDSVGTAFIVGETSSSDLATTEGAAQTVFGGGFSDAFLADFRFCDGAYETYGSACAGSGGFTPELFGNGCPDAGNTIKISLKRGLGGASGLLLVGLGTNPRFGHLCRFDVYPLAAVLPIVLTAGGPGEGTFDLVANVPVSLNPGVLYLQTALFDTGAVANISSTNALAVGLGVWP